MLLGHSHGGSFVVYALFNEAARVVRRKPGNAAFAQQIQSRHYTGLTMVAQVYAGGHLGMIPLAFSNALAFALA